MNKKILISILFLIAFSFVNAQDIKEDLLIMSKLYMSLDKFKMTTKVEHYKKNEIIESNLYEVWKWERYFVQKNKEFDALFNNKILIISTKLDKHISYMFAEDVPNNEIERMANNINFDKIIEDYMLKYDSVKFNGIVKGIKYYRIYSSEFEAKWLDLSFNEKTHLIHKLVYFYDEKTASTTVDKTIQTFNHVLLEKYPSDIFNEQIYVSIKGNKVIPNGKHSKYSISQKNYLSR